MVSSIKGWRFVAVMCIAVVAALMIVTPLLALPAAPVIPSSLLTDESGRKIKAHFERSPNGELTIVRDMRHLMEPGKPEDVKYYPARWKALYAAKAAKDMGVPAAYVYGCDNPGEMYKRFATGVSYNSSTLSGWASETNASTAMDGWMLFEKYGSSENGYLSTISENNHGRDDASNTETAYTIILTSSNRAVWGIEPALYFNGKLNANFDAPKARLWAFDWSVYMASANPIPGPPYPTSLAWSSLAPYITTYDYDGVGEVNGILFENYTTSLNSPWNEEYRNRLYLKNFPATEAAGGFTVRDLIWERTYNITSDTYPYNIRYSVNKYWASMVEVHHCPQSGDPTFNYVGKLGFAELRFGSTAPSTAFSSSNSTRYQHPDSSYYKFGWEDAGYYNNSNWLSDAP